jgi:hypothetical protein
LEVLPYVRLTPVRLLALVIVAAVGLGAGVVLVRGRPVTYEASARVAINTVYPIARFELEGKASSIQSALRTDAVLDPIVQATGLPVIDLRRGVDSEITVGGTAMTVSFRGTEAAAVEDAVELAAAGALRVQVERDEQVATSQLDAANERADSVQAQLDELVAPFGNADLRTLANTLETVIKGTETEIARLEGDDPRVASLQALQAQRLTDRAAIQAVLPQWTRLSNRIDDLEDVRRAAERAADDATGRLGVVESGRAVTIESSTPQSRTQQYLRAGLAGAVALAALTLLLLAVLDQLGGRRASRRGPEAPLGRRGDATAPTPAPRLPDLGEPVGARRGHDIST